MKSQGIAKAWLHDRRSGFIKPDAVGPDLFVHYSALLDCEALTPGGSGRVQRWDQPV